MPWEDPVLALVRPEPDGIGDEGPGAEEARRGPEAEGPRRVMRFENKAKYIRHAFCGLIHNFACMN